MVMTDNQIQQNSLFPLNDAILCLQVLMTTCANGAENITTSEALVRKQLFFFCALRDVSFSLIVFGTINDLHCWLWDVKA